MKCFVHCNEAAHYCYQLEHFISRWFKNVDWEEVYYKQLKPPIVPKVSYDGDTRNFDEYPETDWRQVPNVTEREFRMFDDF